MAAAVQVSDSMLVEGASKKCRSLSSEKCDEKWRADLVSAWARRRVEVHDVLFGIFKSTRLATLIDMSGAHINVLPMLGAAER